MDNIKLAKEIDVSQIRFSDVKANARGKTVYLTHQSKPIYIQTGKRMRCPFGLTRWDNSDDAPAKYDLLVGFDGMEHTESIKEFYEKVEEIDDLMVQKGLENSMNWLGKKITSDLVIQELYTPMIRKSRDKTTGEINNKYPPSFKISVPYRDGKFQCEVYDTNRNEIDLGSVDLKNAKITAIIQCTGVWLVGKKYGISWKAVQMLVELKSSLPKFAFREIEKVEASHSSDEDEVEGLELEKLGIDDDELDGK